jgi:hypothetical protein
MGALTVLIRGLNGMNDGGLHVSVGAMIKELRVVKLSRPDFIAIMVAAATVGAASAVCKTRTHNWWLANNVPQDLILVASWWIAVAYRWFGKLGGSFACEDRRHRPSLSYHKTAFILRTPGRPVVGINPVSWTPTPFVGKRSSRWPNHVPRTPMSFAGGW